MSEALAAADTPASPEPRVITIGDGWATLYLGDCLEVMAALPAADHIITDPPYEDELHGAVGKINRIRNDGRTVPEELGFGGVNTDRSKFASAMVAASKGWVIAFTLAEGVRAWRDDLQAAKAKYDTCLFWHKPDASPRFNGQGAARACECAVTAWCGEGYRSWNGGGKRGFYEHLVNPKGRVSTKAGGHPTEKPVSLMVEIVHDFTKPGDVVLDPFMGSGSTGVACIRQGRRFVGVEQDPKWFDLAVKRLTEAWEEHSRNMDLFDYVKPKQVTMMDAWKDAPLLPREAMVVEVTGMMPTPAPPPPPEQLQLEEVIAVAKADGEPIACIAVDMIRVGAMIRVGFDRDGAFCAWKAGADDSTGIAMATFTPGLTGVYDVATGQLHKSAA